MIGSIFDTGVDIQNKRFSRRRFQTTFVPSGESSLYGVHVYVSPYSHAPPLHVSQRGLPVHFQSWQEVSRLHQWHHCMRFAAIFVFFCVLYGVSISLTVWTALVCLFFFLNSFGTFVDKTLRSSLSPVLAMIFFFFFFLPPLLPPLLPFCCFFCFASLPFSSAYDNQHTDGKPVPICLSCPVSFSWTVSSFLIHLTSCFIDSCNKEAALVNTHTPAVSPHGSHHLNPEMIW